MPTTTTHTLDAPGATLTYDVHHPDQSSIQRPLFVFGSPMDASGFTQLASLFDDRTVITYDPRVGGRSNMQDEGTVTTEIHGEDLHLVTMAIDLGPLDAFGSSGGAAAALAWVVAYPDEVHTLVAHEPPLSVLLEDADLIAMVNADVADTYQRRGYGAAMAKFVQLVMHRGPLTPEYLDQAAPDPWMFGFPTTDDGSRNDPLLAHNLPMPEFTPDAAALRISNVQIVPAVGADATGTIPHRGGLALAALLGVEPIIFPGDHTGFIANEWTPDNDPAAFATKLREALSES